ncbi:unnamed protein product [Symbiodinium microadriaticum]|nr:unnamed protein product [Symbiodinium microadriaticum]
MSFTELVGRRMDPVLSKANIKMISRNSALGNNPCVPYDICVTPFAGQDVDVVHWEQSFNCGPNDDYMDVFEHFIRESISLPNRPIVVFADSWQPNWNKDDCKDKKTLTISDSEKKMLQYVDTTPVEIVANLNKNVLTEKFGGMVPFVDKYKAAGLQLWFHGYYEDYKCHGPYIPDWGCCSAPWHPSKEGHQLRADHHAFIWLLIFREALHKVSEGEKSGEDLTVQLKETLTHIHGEAKYVPAEPLYPSRYPDYLRCFTSFQPRADNSRSLEGLVIPSGDGKPGFQTVIFEDIFDKNILINARSRGYNDFKHVLYGNKDSGALSLKIEVSVDGKAFLCQPPGNWGKYPDGFHNFWDPIIDTKIYLTKYVKDTSGFVFKDTAKRVTYLQKETQDAQKWLCVEFDEPLPAGQHVLSIVPTTEKYIMFSYLLLP